ncbi:hypothetical protein [Methylobacterium sp. B4]|uniref:hypothetical protein n=1 Tax=Methylobacterium sp. B4 TaxID=1938755 RepID=UPI000D772F96|nr:hypothetical protein [Methylobacterium sp. B4]PXW67124.1 hypothetical protein BY998_101692 [Methylobacterium sp. B4]
MTRVYETRGRCLEAAAKHINIGPTKFEALVADGRMPQPRLIDKRVVWDVYELDAAFERLPRRGERPSSPPSVFDDPWNNVAV